METTSDATKWHPLSAVDRRVVGVLVEKAKTTPDAYPMSVNAICTAANQKNNRSPLMQLAPDDVEESLARLRAAGAAAEVQGSGRVPRYRHYLYEWLGVDKVELAVMAELLLRGAQTEGELRGRAARMEPIADLAALRPVLDSLVAKGLVLAITPPGRGQVFAHALFEPRELERLRAEFAGQRAAASAGVETPQPDRDADEPARQPGTPGVRTSDEPSSQVASLSRQIEQLRLQVEDLRAARDDLAALVDSLRHDVDRLKQDLGC
jgi:hypothetical protein